MLTERSSDCDANLATVTLWRANYVTDQVTFDGAEARSGSRAQQQQQKQR
jgi:hypothetical protein